jgi:cyclophilin family peptidyl-prolyl cis-trans isomerase
MIKDIIFIGGLIIAIVVVIGVIITVVRQPDQSSNLVTNNQNTTMPILKTDTQPSNKTNNSNNHMSEDQNPITAEQATINTNMGDITIKFYASDSPKTVANFVKLAREGFYNGIKFHRIIKDFMIQAGDPLTKDDSQKSRWGTGGPGYKFEDEFNSHPLVKGSLAMANAGPNTNGSQFFIVTAESTPWLDGKHTNFGEVISGIDIVEAMNNVDTEGPDRPVNDVVITSIEVK